ncbi:hypothetical protein BASA62_005195 [Batrachochytrium salamandrivorans]|nr:hypothetical protein BASA62_005195 [Batrachochytrium salamandrivorans]
MHKRKLSTTSSGSTLPVTMSSKHAVQQRRPTALFAPRKVPPLNAPAAERDGASIDRMWQTPHVRVGGAVACGIRVGFRTDTLQEHCTHQRNISTGRRLNGHRGPAPHLPALQQRNNNARRL